MFCPKCGTENADAAAFCQKCGQPLAAAAVPPAAPTPVQVVAVPIAAQPDKGTSGMAIASLVLGIAGTFLFFLFVPSVLAVIFGAVGISATGANSNRRGRGMAIAGMILGIVVVAFGILYWTVLVTAFRVIGV